MEYLPPQIVVLLFQDRWLPRRKKVDDLNKLTDLMRITLEKGLDEVQMKELLDSLLKLPNKKFHFSLAGTQGQDGGYYYYFIFDEKDSLIGRLWLVTRRFFSLHKTHQEFEEQRISREITRSYIGDIIENAIETGLSDNQLLIFRELVYLLFYTNLELALKIEKNNRSTIVLTLS